MLYVQARRSGANCSLQTKRCSRSQRYSLFACIPEKPLKCAGTKVLSMADLYDLIVLGTGTAGGIPARQCRDSGWSVLNVENRTPGGTCAQRGCDAKKPLVEAAAAVDLVNRLTPPSLKGRVEIDWTHLIEFKNSFTDPVSDKERHDLKERGIELVEGEPRFIDEESIEVDGRRFRGKHMLIATGMIPRPLDFPGSELMITSADFLQLHELPANIVFVGGGYVSMELAHVAVRAGCSVEIVQREERPLTGFDPDLVDLLVQDSRDLGIRFHLNSCVDRVEKTDSGLCARCTRRDQGFAADLVVHGAGRVPSILDLDLEKGNVQTEDGGIAVNQYLQNPTNQRVYAAGDCTAGKGKPLTPVANLEAKVVVANLLEGNHATPDYTGIPSAVFTSPPLAMVGLTEPQARDQDLDVEVRFEDVTSHKEMRQMGVRRAAYKLLVDRQSDRLVGAHFFGPGAQDLINLAAMAMRLQIPVSELSRTVFAYPTLTGSLGWIL
jgi:glutathione reductase (NADPH)